MKLKTLTTKGASGGVVESHDVSYVSDGIYVKRAPPRYLHPQEPRGGRRMHSNTVRRPLHLRRARALDAGGQRSRTSTAYKLDAAGNILEETQSGATSATKSYTYDGNRLGTLTAGGLTSKYFYDEWGNVDCVTLQAGV